jgi:hypothetical protein
MRLRKIEAAEYQTTRELVIANLWAKQVEYVSHVVLARIPRPIKPRTESE